jgi:hypothetical protein
MPPLRATPRRIFLPEKLRFPRIREYEMSQIPVCNQLKTLQLERNLAHGSEESTEAGT